MLARDIMTTPVTTLDEGHNVREAVEIVNASKIGAVPVLDGEGRLTGIVTEGDLLRRVASSWARRAVPHTRDREPARRTPAGPRHQTPACRRERQTRRNDQPSRLDASASRRSTAVYCFRRRRPRDGRSLPPGNRARNKAPHGQCDGLQRGSDPEGRGRDGAGTLGGQGGGGKHPRRRRRGEQHHSGFRMVSPQTMKSSLEFPPCLLGSSQTPSCRGFSSSS